MQGIYRAQVYRPVHGCGNVLDWMLVCFFGAPTRLASPARRRQVILIHENCPRPFCREGLTSRLESCEVTYEADVSRALPSTYA